MQRVRELAADNRERVTFVCGGSRNYSRFLDVFDEVKVCVAYDGDGVRHEHLPYHQSDLHAAVPVYAELPGWNQDLTQCTQREELPPQAVAYLEFLQEQVGVPITFVGTGPGREQFVQFNS